MTVLSLKQGLFSSFHCTDGVGQLLQSWIWWKKQTFAPDPATGGTNNTETIHTHAADANSILTNSTNCQQNTMLTKVQITEGLVTHRKLKKRAHTQLDFTAEKGRNSARDHEVVSLQNITKCSVQLPDSPIHETPTWEQATGARMKIKVTCFINLTRLPLPYQVLDCPAHIIKAAAVSKYWKLLCITWQRRQEQDKWNAFSSFLCT